MQIDMQTKIGDLLDAYPELEKTLLELSPAFARLRNPVMRRTMAKVASIQHAAGMAGISAEMMVRTLRKAAGQTVDSDESTENEDHTTPETNAE